MASNLLKSSKDVKGEKGLSALKQLIDQVEKRLVSSIKLKITFNTSEAEKSLDKRTAQLKKLTSLLKGFRQNKRSKEGSERFP